MGAPRLITPEATVALLKGLPFFDRFQPEWLELMARVTTVSVFQKGEMLLTQGMPNAHLYFLLSGSVEIIVDDQPVAVMDKKGDLFGEMSVISNQPVTASVRATTPIEVVWFEAKALTGNAMLAAGQLQELVFRLYSHILTDKLKATNQKAKFFERANEKLAGFNKELEQKVAERTQDIELKRKKLESQNAELMVTHRKFEQMYKDRDLTFTKLEELYRNHLLPLQFSFNFLQNHTNEETRGALKQASGQVQELVRLLEPITTLITSEKAAKSRRVLCAEPEKKQQIVARLALGGSGVSLDIVSGISEAEPLLQQNLYDIVFFHPDCADVAVKALSINPLAHLVLFTSDNPMAAMEKIKGLGFIPNVVSRSEEDRIFSIKNISTTVTKLAAADVFGLQKYLSWGMDVQNRIIRSSKDRGALAAEVDSHFGNLGIRKSVRDRALQVLEEMLMNAIYDAPVDSHGKSLFNHLTRTETVNLAVAQESRLSFATDGMLLAISVTDPFGSLRGETILKYLESCYGGAAGSLNADKGGAGRGLHLIVENSDLVVFNLQSKVQSEVIAFFSVDPKEQLSKFPSFHLFLVK